jgi:hypothetical protein
LKTLRTYVPILLLALLPVCAMGIGRPGDDIQFHVSSWMEMLDGWRSGVMLPAWAAHAAFNLGEPRFYFYPPLSLWLGAELLTVVPAAAIAQVYVWVVMVLAGVSMLALGKELLPPADRVKAALLYMTSYYLIVAGLLRFAVAELLTAALLPLVVLFYLRLLRGGRMKDGAALSVALAATWMTDAPAAVVVFYGLLLTCLVDAAVRRSVRSLVAFAVAEVGALLLSAWYMLPALAAKRQIAAASLLHFRWSDFLLFHTPAKGLTPAMRYPLWGWVELGTVAVVWLTVRPEDGTHAGRGLRDAQGSWLRGPEVRLAQRLLCLMVCVGLFCQLPVSGLLWRYLPQFSYVQFGYRFDVFLACVLPVVLLLRVRSPRGRLCLYVVWVVFLIVPFATKIGQQHSRAGLISLRQVADSVPEGYAGYDEYSTAGVGHGAAVVAGNPIANVGAGGCVAVEKIWEPERRDVASLGEQACVYRVALNYYPDWHLWIDGEQARSFSAGADGTMVVVVPAGEHVASLRFVRPRGVAVVGGVMSVVALVLLVCAWFGIGKPRAQRETTRT